MMTCVNINGRYGHNHDDCDDDNDANERLVTRINVGYLNFCVYFYFLLMLFNIVECVFIKLLSLKH